MNAWESLLLALGGNAILLTVLGWLARSLLGQIYAKDLERFKSELAAASTAATERLKHDLRLTAQEHQVVVSKLHEKRAMVVAEVYGLLAETQWASSDFVTQNELDHSVKNKQEKYVVAMNTIAKLERFYDKNRIYLPEAVCKRLDELDRKMSVPVLGFGAFVNTPEPLFSDPKIQKLRDEMWVKAEEQIRNEVPILRRMLEAELRVMIEGSPPNAG